MTELTELPLSETADEQDIGNLLNEYSDSEYECQNDHQLWTLLNFKINEVNKFCRYVFFFFFLYV